MKNIICFLIISALIALSITGCSGKRERSDIKYDENNVGEIYAAEIDPEHIAIGESEIKYVDNEVLLVANNEVSKKEIEALAKDINAEIVGYIEQTGDYQLKFSQAMTEKEVGDLIADLNSNSLIESASFNYVFDIATTSVDYNINDGEKWSTGSTSNLWQGPLLALLLKNDKAWGVNAINAPLAWSMMNTIKEKINPVNIGLIDNGFDETHEDLEFKQVFYENWANRVDNAAETHGTHVAGTMAARGDNKEGICGVYPYGKTRLYASGDGIEDYSINGSFFTSVMTQKIAYSELILRNVKVINQSQGFNWYFNKFTDNDKQTDYKALSDFWNNKNFSDYFIMSKELGGFFNRLLKQGYDFIIVSAAGNDSDKSIGHLDSTLSSWNNMIKYDDYPDVYNRIIVVGSVGKSLDISDFSNAGERVDIYAPGENIYSTIPGSDYSYNTGTSMAAPHVAGVAANVWSINNGLSGDKVKRIVCSSVNANSKDGVPVVDCAVAVKKAIEGNDDLKIDEIQNGGILGWVFDGDYRSTPIENVSVVPYSNGTALTDYGVTTDEYGHFELIIPSGDYELHFTKEGYDEKILSATSSNGEVDYFNEGIDEVIGLDKSGTSNTYSWIMEPTYEYNDVQILECFFGQPYGRASLARAVDDFTYMPTEELQGLFVAETDGSKILINLSGNALFSGDYSQIRAMAPPRGDSFFIYVNSNSDSKSYWIDENYKPIKDTGLGMGGLFEDNYYYNIDDSSVWLESFMEYQKVNKSELPNISSPIESVKVVQGERKYDTEIRTDLPGTGKFGLLSYGNITVPMEYDGYYRLSSYFYYYDSVYGFSEEGRIVFYKDNKIYVFDENGKCYSEGKYDIAENANQEKYYYQGYLPVSLDGKWGYIDIYGNEVVSCQFEDVTSVYDGKAWVKKGGKWGVIELTNRGQNTAIEEIPDNLLPNAGLKKNQTAEQLRKNIVGDWVEYSFDENGNCYFYGDKNNSGTYEITESKTLIIKFPWTQNKYTWSDKSFNEFHEDHDYDEYFWFFTTEGVLRLNGTDYYRNGVFFSFD